MSADNPDSRRFQFDFMDVAGEFAFSSVSYHPLPPSSTSELLSYLNSPLPSPVRYIHRPLSPAHPCRRPLNHPGAASTVFTVCLGLLLRGLFRSMNRPHHEYLPVDFTVNVRITHFLPPHD